MQRESIKLIVLDLDGTLLDSKKNVDDKTLDLLKRLHNENGIKLAIATGRDSATVLPIVNHFRIEEIIDLLIMNNGATVFYSKNNYWEYNDYLTTSKIKEIYDLFQNCRNITLCFHNKDTFYANRITDKIISIKEKNGRTYLKNPLIDKDYESTPRVMAIMDKPNDEEFMNYAKKHLPKNVTAYHSEDTIFEFLDHRTSKVNAIKKYCEKCSILMKNVMAFGDSDNDATLLKECGIGICMINGTKKALESADEVTEFTSDQNGIYYYLEKLFHSNSSI